MVTISKGLTPAICGGRISRLRPTLRLIRIPNEFAICKLDPEHPIPAWAVRGPVWSVTRTMTELSIVCGSSVVPEGVVASTGWRAVQLDGPLAFDMIGVISSLTVALAKADIPVFVLSTFDTDLLLVRSELFERACLVLSVQGHTIDS